VLFLGTSLTAGLGLDPDSAYPMLIQRRIQAAGLPWEVTNAGVSGETSAGLLRRLDWVLKQPAQVIVVETGANDGLRGLDASATEATIGAVLDRIRKERPEASVYLVQMEAPTNMGEEYTRRFHAMFPALAKEKKVTLIPFLLAGVAGDSRLNQADGIHPNDLGEHFDQRLGVLPFHLVVGEKAEPGERLLSTLRPRLLLDGCGNAKKEGQIRRILLHAPGPDVLQFLKALLIDESGDFRGKLRDGL
jgi:acyl-CoA thioesterase-1